MNLYRHLPPVDKILAHLNDSSTPRELLRKLVTDFLDICRRQIQNSELTQNDLEWENLFPKIITFINTASRSNFRQVLNATGVVVHTNLGRSLLAPEALQAVQHIICSYSNLELSLANGKRGSRYSHVEELLCFLTGAEAALVVNNNAAAVLLILDTLAKGKEVIVSRGQLVEIGGSFRIPEIITRSGAILREVGATNRTHLKDYEQAINNMTAAFLRVHTSNYRIIGFTSEVELPEMAALGKKYNLPTIEDLGSGNLFDFSPWQKMHEPTVQQVVKAGIDIISFSGDKLLGGPQAGIIIGKKIFLDQLKKNPLNRALRIDKMTLASLEATLRLYLEPETVRQKIPTLRMITATKEELTPKAEKLAEILRKKLPNQVKITLYDGQSQVGGGAFPEQNLPTTLLAVQSKDSPENLRQALLRTEPPLIGRIENNAFCLDVRTLDEQDFSLIGDILAQAIFHQK